MHGGFVSPRITHEEQPVALHYFHAYFPMDIANMWSIRFVIIRQFVGFTKPDLLGEN